MWHVEQLVCHCCYELFPRQALRPMYSMQGKVHSWETSPHQNIYTRISVQTDVCILSFSYLLICWAWPKYHPSCFISAGKSPDHFLPGETFHQSSTGSIKYLHSRTESIFLFFVSTSQQCKFSLGPPGSNQKSLLQSKEKACWHLWRSSQSVERIRPSVQMIACCGMLSSLAVFRRKAKRNRNLHMFSKPWSGEYREMHIGCWISYGSGAKTSIPCFGFDTEQWGYNSPNEVANPSILFAILHCSSAKRSGLIHDMMIGRCNVILIVPMCLWILLWLNKQNRLSLIERFIIRVICTTRLFLMLWSFRCSLVKIFWGLYSLLSLLEVGANK